MSVAYNTFLAASLSF